jgi:phosphoglycolate phosphatase
LLETLKKLNIKWGIVTNKPRLYAEKLVKKLELSGCAVLICPEDVTISKPNPEGLLLAAKLLECDVNACIYVGDHVRDIEAGKQAGMKTVAARYGYVESPLVVDQWDADWIIDHPEELMPLLTTKTHPAMLNIKR